MMSRLRNAIVWSIATPLRIVGDAIDEALDVLEGEDEAA